MNIVRGPMAALALSPLVGQIRLLASPTAEGDRPAYIGTCTTLQLSPTELVITALAGQGITRAHLCLVASSAYRAGYRWIYAERLPGHTLPLARCRSERPLSGWFELDLEHVMEQIPSLQPTPEQRPHA